MTELFYGYYGTAAKIAEVIEREQRGMTYPNISVVHEVTFQVDGDIIPLKIVVDRNGDYYTLNTNPVQPSAPAAEPLPLSEREALAGIIAQAIPGEHDSADLFAAVDAIHNAGYDKGPDHVWIRVLVAIAGVYAEHFGLNDAEIAALDAADVYLNTEEEPHEN